MILLPDISIESPPDKKLPRVTTIIDLLKVIPLEQWKIGKAVEYVKHEVVDLLKSGLITLDEFQRMDTDKILEQAKNWSKEITKKYASIGSKVHDAIEQFNMAQENETIDIETEIEKPFEGFLTWWEKNNVDPIIVEQRLWSLDSGGYTGKIDMAAFLGEEPEKKLFVLDFKTSPGLYDSFMLQLSSYFYAFKQRTGMEPDHGAILKIDRDTGVTSFHMFNPEQMAFYYGRFLDLVSYWHRTND